MKRAIILCVCFISLWMASGCGNNDPKPFVCRVYGLAFDNDSTIYTYDDLGRIKKVAYYETGLKTKEDQFGYNSQGKLSTIDKEKIFFDGSRGLEYHHDIEYDGNGYPTQLTTEPYNSWPIVTTFTHDDNRRLTSASATTTNPGTGDTYSVGSTRYEYDDSNNIPKVFYTVRVLGSVKEVLARENLDFDDTEKFYVNTPELKIANEYVYGYLPAKNNCLSSNVIYYSYTQHFASPMPVTFVATYSDDGKIKSLKNDEPGNQYFSGDVLFTNIAYRCN